MATVPVPVPQNGHESKAPELGVVQLGELAEVKPLKLAARFVDNYRARDEKYPPLLDIATAHTSEFYCAPDISNPKGASYTPFTSRLRPLPRELLAGGVKAESSGLLPEIDRAWFAMGQQLLLWNYTTGEVQSFDEMPAKINTVALVPPKRDVFSSLVEHILLICTTEAIHLYAIGASKRASELEVYDTSLNIAAPNFGTLRICPGVRSGRIFFTSSEKGHTLFEARYSNKESWFRSRTGIVTHGSAFSFLASKADGHEVVVDICYDNSRNILYTLSSDSDVRIYTVGDSEGSVSLASTYTHADIKSLMAPALADGKATNGHKGLSEHTVKIPDSESSRLVTISAYSEDASKSLPLSAVTSTGLRVYFRCRDPRWATSLISALVRHPSTDRQVEGAVSPTKILDRDFLVALIPNADRTKNTASYSLFTSIIDSTRVIHQTDHGIAAPFAEVSGWMPLEGTPLSVVLKSPPQQSIGPHGEGFGNQAALGYTHSAPEAVILTSTGAYSVRARHFYERLEVGSESPLQLSYTYGHMELCCAALAVATRPNTHVSKQQRDLAVNAYFRLGGLSVFKKDIEATRNTYIHDPTTAIGSTAKAADAQVSVRLSSLFDGLAAYVARLLEAIWTKQLLSYKMGRDGKPTDIRFTVSKTKLEDIYSLLAGLHNFLDNNRSFSEGMSNRPQYSQHIYAGDVSVLNQAEHRSLSSLGTLVRSSQQGIAFLLLIASETASTQDGLESLLMYFSKENLDKFLRLSFKNFFSEAKESEAARELVTCLVNYVINRGGSIDSVARIIQDRCDSYCSASDILIYKALQSLRTASTINAAKDNDVRLQSLFQSVSLLKKAAADIQLETLQDIIKEYVSLKFYPGVAEIVLAASAEIDRAGAAISYVRDNKPAHDPREVIYEKRLHYFHLLTNVLSDMDAHTPAGKETYRILMDSKDELFHFYLYDWFLKNGQTEKLSRISSPFILAWLQTGAKQDVKVAELLWRYYVRQGDPLAAADVLLELGRGALPVSMADRIEYLSRAMNYCNSEFVPGSRQKVVQLTTMVNSYLQIANVQSDVLTQIERDPRLSPHAKETAEAALSARLLTITELFNDYADLYGYYAVCLEMFEVSDYREQVEIRRTWENLLNKTRVDDELDGTQHYTHVSSLIQQLGRRFLNTSFVFPVDWLVPYLEQYAVEYTPGAPRGWVVEAFLNAGVSHDVLFSLLMDLLTQALSPFNNPDAATSLAEDILFLLNDWITSTDSWQLSQRLTQKDLKLLAANAGSAEVAKFTEVAAA